MGLQALPVRGARAFLPASTEMCAGPGHPPASGVFSLRAIMSWSVPPACCQAVCPGPLRIFLTSLPTPRSSHRVCPCMAYCGADGVLLLGQLTPACSLTLAFTSRACLGLGILP